MYPRNAASPERVAVGAVVQISDGVVQTSGVSIKVKPQGAAASAGGGTTSYEEGIVGYVPTQGETDYTSFQIIAYKTGCIPVAVTVVTSASATAGHAGVDQSKIANPTSTVNLSGTTIKTATDVETDTADIQARLPAALVGGRIDANMGAISADVTAADNLESALDGTGGVTITGNITGNLSGSVGSVTGAVGSVAGNVAGSIGSLAAQAKADVNAEVDAALVDVRLDELLAADSDIDGAAPPTTGSVFHELMSKTAGSFTFDQATDSLEALRDNVGAAGAGLTAVPWNAAWDAEVQSEVSDGLLAYGAATATDVTTAAANVSVDEIQTTALADLFNTNSGTTYASSVAGSVVKEIVDNAGGSGLTAGAIADAVWDEAISGHLTSGSTGEALSAAGGAGDPWITTLPGSYSAGQAGYILGTNLNATVSSRASQTSVDTVDDFLDTEVAAIKAKTDNLPLDPADASDIAAAFATVNTKLDTIDGIVDDILVDTAQIGAAGAGLTAVPWNIAWDAEVESEVADALGAYDPPTYAEMAARTLASADYATAALLTTVAGYIDTEVAAIKAKTDNLPASPAATGDIPTATQNADALLNRDMGAVSDTNARSPLNALRFLRNKWSIAGSTLTVTKEDDSTSAWTATVSTTPGADPVTGNDPA